MSQAPPTTLQRLTPDKAAELATYRDQADAARQEATVAAHHDRLCASAYRAMRAATGLPQQVLNQLGFPPPPPDTWALRPL